MKTAGKTRSSQYRAVDRNPELRKAADALIAIRKAHRNAKGATLAAYARTMAQLGLDPDEAIRACKRTLKAAGGRIAAHANQRKATDRRALVELRVLHGSRQVDIAAELGISTRRVRQLAKRVKAEMLGGDWSQSTGAQDNSRMSKEIRR